MNGEDNMQIGEEFELTISDFFEMAEKEGGVYEIETPDGWVQLGDLVKKRNKECYLIRLKDGRELGGSKDHYVLTNGNVWKPLEKIDVEKDCVQTKDSFQECVSREYIGIRDTFDFEVLHENHRYFSNGIVSHNTGKTAFVRALGQELDMPIFIFDLATMTNGDFLSRWEETVSAAPSIALFEDIDGVFHGRKNVSCTSTMDQGLSFDCFLNVIDGVDNTDGVLKIVTTNNISHIDPALGINANGDGMSTRPGRIDKIVEFLPLDEAGKLKMAKRIFNGFPEQDWLHILKEGEHDTGAQYQERCCSLAIKLFWIKDDSFRNKIFEDIEHKTTKKGTSEHPAK